MIRLNPELYCELFKDWPNPEMELSGWDSYVKYYFFGFFPIIYYTKKLYK